MKKSFIIFFFLLLLQSQRVRAQSKQSGLEPDTHNHEKTRQPKEVIFVAVISILLFVAFYCIYLCCCIDDHIINIGNWSLWRSRNFLVGSFRHSMSKVLYGLDPSVVKSFPTFEYEAVKSKMIGKNTLECAVCLMEYNDKDVLRLIPKCDHVFHAECVDNWLVSHATCPVCRFNLTNADLWDCDTSQHDTFVEVVQDQGDNDNGNNHQGMIKNMSMSRSLSTGHMDKFTIRLPREVWKQIMMNGNNTNLWVKSGESSLKAGYREGFNVEGNSRSKSERFVRNNNGKAFSFRKHFTSKDGSSLGVVVPVEPNQLPV